jgi:hypothetical protein
VYLIQWTFRTWGVPSSGSGEYSLVEVNRRFGGSSVNFYYTTRRHISENGAFYSHLLREFQISQFLSYSFIHQWLYSPLLGPDLLFSFVISQGRYLQHKQTSMTWVGFEPTIPVFERTKTVHALNRAATVIGSNILVVHSIMHESVRNIRGTFRLRYVVFARRISRAVPLETSTGSLLICYISSISIYSGQISSLCNGNKMMKPQKYMSISEWPWLLFVFINHLSFI